MVPVGLTDALRGAKIMVRGAVSSGGLLVNVEAFDNLKRVLRSVPPESLDMSNWNRCAIGHACDDAWFRERRLDTSFASARRVFGIDKPQAVHLFTRRAGTTPDEVIATIEWFVRAGAEAEAELYARRQAIIDSMLAQARKVERVARSAVRTLVAMFGI